MLLSGSMHRSVELMTSEVKHRAIWVSYTRDLTGGTQGKNDKMNNTQVFASNFSSCAACILKCR